MNVISLSAALPRRGRLLRLLVDHNPFYLLSALCMLGGLLTLTNSLSYSPIPQRHLLMLIATLNCYELLLVTLALWLIASRKLIRDGSILLGIEAVFLVDTAMLNAELFTVDPRLGAVVNLGLLLLAAAKLALIFRVLRVQSPGAYGLILATLFLLFALPGIFKEVANHDNGRLSSLAIYGAWWAIGLLPVFFAMVFRRPDGLAKERRPQAHGRLVLTFVLFAFASTLIHLRLSNWVYQVGWEWANLSPLVLGVAVCVGSLDTHVPTLALRMRTQLALPLLAVALSLRFSSDLLFSIGPLALSPMRVAFAGATLVYLHGLWMHRHVYFVIASGICLAFIGVGASPDTARQNVEFVWNWLVSNCRRFQPRTASDWGVLSIVASFVLLLIGAAVSILRGPSSSAPDASPLEVS
jgi:hypothetical protein